MVQRSQNTRVVRRRYVQNVKPKPKAPSFAEETPPPILRRGGIAVPRRRHHAMINLKARRSFNLSFFYDLIPWFIPLAILLALIFALWQPIKDLLFAPDLKTLRMMADQSIVVPKLPKLETSNALRVKHKMRSGQTLPAAIESLGFPRNIARDIFHEILAQRDSNDKSISIQRGQNVEFFFDRNAQLAKLIISLPKGNELILKKKNAGSFSSKLRVTSRQNEERVALGIIESSFAAAAAKAKISYELVDELVDLFSGQINFHRDFKKGDRFVIIYQDRLAEDGSSLGHGPILAAALTTNGEEYVAVRYVGTDGKARFFKKDGELIGETFLRYPLKFSRISSYFSSARFHPILHRPRKHNGVDFAAPIGTPVRTVADGKVIKAGNYGAAGVMLTIQHSERYSTSYLHLQKIAEGIVKGSTVTKGQLIGYVGSTGLSTGPHLHFALYDRGQYVDPLSNKLPSADTLRSGTKIEKKYLGRVLFTINHYLKVDLSNSYLG